MAEAFRNDDMRASHIDFIDEAAVSGRLKQNESLLDHIG
jgi:hypothetical protein